LIYFAFLFIMFQATVVASVLAVSSGRLFPEDPVQQKQLWDQFKANHGKRYDTMAAETTRFGHFLENLKSADSRNAAEGANIHGITKFSDMSQAEFEATMLKSDVSMKTLNKEITVVSTPVNMTAGLVDWSGKYTTPIKDQGYCGSCWAFSATEQIESDSMRTLGTSYVLSPAQITQCDNTSSGCRGGWSEHAYNYVQRAGGIELDSDYPYTTALYQGLTGSCSANINKAVITVSGYSTLSGEAAMASYVQTTGPLSVCVDASSWNSYTSGIMSVCGKSVDHCVQAVGVDTSSYWKVRNSWGTSWGESGYIRLKYGANTCDITNDPTYVKVGKK